MRSRCSDANCAVGRVGAEARGGQHERQLWRSDENDQLQIASKTKQRFAGIGSVIGRGKAGIAGLIFRRNISLSRANYTQSRAPLLVLEKGMALHGGLGQPKQREEIRVQVV